MGALAAIAPILGLFAGMITASLAKSEVQQGKKYFVLLQNLILGCIIIILLWNFGIIWAFVSGAIAFLILWKTGFAYQLYLTPILAIPAATMPGTQIPIFLYFVPTGTLNKSIKKAGVAAIVYSIIAILFA